MPGFPRNTQSLGASRRKAVSRYPRPTSARPPDIIAAVIGRLRRVTGWRLRRRLCLRGKILYLSLLHHKYGNAETYNSYYIYYPCARSARFRRPSAALSGETNTALPRPSDHYRERLALKTTEQRAKITDVAGRFWACFT